MEEQEDLAARTLRRSNERAGWRSKIRVLGWLLLVIASGLVALEFGLRTWSRFGSRPVQTRSARYGWRFLPDQDAAFVHDPGIPERINSWGFRDREWRSPESGDPDAEVRVALLGNSFTYGSGVPVEATWGRRLEARLAVELERRGDPRRVVVMNFAAPAYTTEQSLRVYEDVAAAWEPELVILSMHPMDMLPMAPSEDAHDALPEWIRRTALHDLLAAKLFPTAPPAGPEHDAWRREFEAMQQNPYGQGVFAHWLAAGRRLAEVRAAIEARGGRLVVFALPILAYWAPPYWPSPALFFDPWIEDQRAAAEDTTVLFFDPTEEFVTRQGRLTEAIRERGLVASPRNTAAIDDTYPEAELALYLREDFGHYSARGHDVLAELVARRLLDAGLP